MFFRILHDFALAMSVTSFARDGIDPPAMRGCPRRGFLIFSSCSPRPRRALDTLSCVCTRDVRRVCTATRHGVPYVHYFVRTVGPENRDQTPGTSETYTCGDAVTIYARYDSNRTSPPRHSSRGNVRGREQFPKRYIVSVVYEACPESKCTRFSFQNINELRTNHDLSPSKHDHRFNLSIRWP